jgi:CheY-like chemotaxis protein
VRACGLGLQGALPDEPLYVEADPVRLAQIVGNLLDNAKKFTEDGGSIAVEVELADGGVALTVRDSGIGMTDETLENIFEPFFQGNSSLERSAGGLGLGLALVKGLVELLHGTVRAESPGLGRGARFIVWLPRVGEEPGVAAPPPRPKTRSHAHRILIIEDDADAAELLQLTLKLAGHDVLVATTGQQGLQLAQDFRPTVVLSDIGLPSPLSGYDVARALRADAQLQDAVLIAITGFGQAEDRRRALEAGFTHHLIKPVDVAALEELLAQLPTAG